MPSNLLSHGFIFNPAAHLAGFASRLWSAHLSFPGSNAVVLQAARHILTHTSHCPPPPHYPLLYTEDGFLLEMYSGYQHLLITPHSCCLWLFGRHRSNSKAFMSCFVCPTLTPSEIIFQPFLTKTQVAWLSVEKVLKRLQHRAVRLQEHLGLNIERWAPSEAMTCCLSSAQPSQSPKLYS